MTILKHVKGGHHANFPSLCPRCGSNNIASTIGVPVKGGLGTNGYCRDCLSIWAEMYKFAYWEFAETCETREEFDARIAI